MSEATKEKIRAKKLERDKDPEYQAKINAALAKRRAEDPEYGKRISEGLKKWNQTVEGKTVQQRKSVEQSQIKTDFYASVDGQHTKEVLSQKTKAYFETHEHPNKGVHLDNSAAVEGANRHREQFGHPWQGLHHSEETKQKLREKRAAWFTTSEGKAHKLKVGKVISKYYTDPIHREIKSNQQIERITNGDMKHLGRGISGVREDIGHFVRSRLEANYARILKYQCEPYLYEPRTFKLSDGRHYMPDFYLTNSDTYIETKGYWSQESREKFKMFQKEYPHIKIHVLMQSSEEWKSLVEKYRPLIQEWEGIK